MDRFTCVNCTMDKTAVEIFFDENGVCNFCHEAKRELILAKMGKNDLFNVVNRIKADGVGREYDALIGLSGGVDSSMVLHHAVKFGLRVLCFNVDNGWNRANESDENVLKMVEKLQVPFYRYVIDRKAFNNCYALLMKAGVKNLEALTDHILFAATYEMANKYKIKWILSGGNVATESVMPASWGEDARDLYWLKKICGNALEKLPTISLLKEQYYRLVKQKKFLRLLDYVDYDRNKSIELLKKLYNYKEYGEKHCESVLTQWHMNFYLFEKWGIDKRKAHLSSLINSGQISREDALNELQKNPVYPQIGLESKVMSYPKREDHPNSKWIRQKVARFYRFIPKRWK